MDGQPGASDTGRLEAAVQRGGQGPARERCRVDPVDRRVAMQYRIKIRWQLASTRSAPGLSPDEAMGHHGVGAEPGGNILTR